MNKFIFILCLSVVGIFSMGYIESPAHADTVFYFKGSIGPSTVKLDDGTIYTSSSEGAAVGLSAGAKLSHNISLYLDLKGISVRDFYGCSSCELNMGSRGFPGLGIGFYTKSKFNTHLVFNTMTVDTDYGESERFPMVFWSIGKDWPIINLDNFSGVSATVGAGDVNGVSISTLTLSWVYTYN